MHAFLIIGFNGIIKQNAIFVETYLLQVKLLSYTFKLNITFLDIRSIFWKYKNKEAS